MPTQNTSHEWFVLFFQPMPFWGGLGLGLGLGLVNCHSDWSCISSVVYLISSHLISNLHFVSSYHFMGNTPPQQHHDPNLLIQQLSTKVTNVIMSCHIMWCHVMILKNAPCILLLDGIDMWCYVIHVYIVIAWLSSHLFSYCTYLFYTIYYTSSYQSMVFDVY